MTERKANHQVNIVRVKEILPHNNADSLEIIPIGEYQVVSRIGQFKIGDLAVYIQPDSVIPQTSPFRFIWEPYMCEPVPTVDDPACERTFQVPEKRRRITVRKFRGEWSEGLLLPVTDFDELVDSTLTRHFVESDFPESTDVSDLLGITHYDPDAGKFDGSNEHAPSKKKGYPRTIRGWFRYITRRIKQFIGLEAKTDGSSESVSLNIPTYDVEALKNYPNTFTDGEPVIVTEKIHGSNARFIYLDSKQYAGSRNLWKSPNSNCIFRRVLNTQPWIGEWCERNPGYVLWGEVTPTQGGYEYGSKEPQFFVFDVRTPDGKWLDREHDEAGLLAQLMSHSVPILYQGPYDLVKIKTFVDGPSTVPGAKNIREGVVIKTATEGHARGVGRKQMKIVSNAYLMKDNK
jgi:tRNA-binding EMAP/Myf-like protein